MAKSATMFKPGYEGHQPKVALRPDERAGFEDLAEGLVRRLHTAMLVLSVLDDHNVEGKGSNWPAYVHDRGDKNAQAELRAPEPKPKVFRPTPAQMSEFIGSMELLDGLRSIYQQVLFLRAVGEFFGGWSFDEIGDRYGKTGEWARSTYNAVVVQAARRAGVLPDARHDWAILVAGVRHGGWRSFMTTAQDPAKQLRNLKSMSPIAIQEAFCIWTPGQPAAKRLVGVVRQVMLGRPRHGSWHLMGPDDIADQIIHAARMVGVIWSMETLPISPVKTAIIRTAGSWSEPEEWDG